MLRKVGGISATLAAVAALVGAGTAGAVLGGKPDANAHPYVGAAIQPQGDGTELCSGFLISPTVFVTAAHCFPYDFGRTAYVSFDENPLATGNFIPGTVYNNPKFCFLCGNGTPNSDTHDLAVIVLSQPVTLPRYAQLPTQGLADTLKNAQIDVLGYGIQGWSGKGVPTSFGSRQIATTKTASAGVLSNEFVKLLASPGSCLGDSGGPNLVHGTDVVVAETTFGRPQCNGISYSERIDTPDALAFINGGYLSA